MPSCDTSRAAALPSGRAARRAWALLLLSLLATPALFPVATAQEEEDLTAGLAELDHRLAQGKAAFLSLNFPEAIGHFTAVVDLYEGGKVQDVGADVVKKIAEALDLRARSYFNQGDRERARADFQKLLKVKIDYQIDSKMVSPKVIELFNDVKKASVGSLSVATDPPGAEAFLGEDPLDKTPIVGRALMQGTYKLRLVLKGFEDYEEDVAVTPRTELKKEVRLKPNRRILQFVTQPNGVNVLVDGQLVGTTFGTLPPEQQSLARDAGIDPARASAPLLVPNVTPGDHQVRFEKECYEPTPRSVTVTLDVERNAPQTFQPVVLKQDMGQISITSHPSGAEVLVNGRSQGTTPLQQTTVCAGEQEIRLVKKGEGTWFEKVRIKPDVLNTLDARLRPTLLYLGTFRLDVWGRLNWSDEDATLLEGLKTLRSVNQVRANDDLKTFREALVKEMTRPEGVDELKKGKGIPAPRVLDALNKFQADLLMAVLSIEEPSGKGTSTVWLYAADQPAPDRAAIDLTHEEDVRAVLARFDRVPEQSRPWVGAAFSDSLIGEGPVVVRLAKGSPAASAGLLPGDQIVTMNSKKISEARSLAPSSGWKENDKAVFGVKREGPVLTVPVTVGSTPVLVPLNSPDYFYNKILCDYRQMSRGADTPLERSLALVNLGIAFMHFQSYDKALTEAFNLASLPAGPGISRGTVRYYQGLCYQKKELVPEARTAFQEAAASPDATLESNDGPPVAARARKLLQ
ncbi:MAG TPA: PEGA domain-containing protein [Candidatus Polarisedimenticolia bacterium]|jgi:tetratricopeptide (TPR) repeat protein|nr:PEGA domain-containing protein [Candidatus Polarisedimenticolia bacterium]